MIKSGGIRIGALVSGGGSNLQSIIDGCESGCIDGRVVVVISSKPGAYAVERAKRHGIDVAVIDFNEYNEVRKFSEAILEKLREYDVDLVCMAGFMRILDRVLTDAYRNRIMNIHPALLPSFGGRGMYGRHVHKAVIDSGIRYSGATVHFVTDETDVGPIIIQGVVEVMDDDTPDSLAEKVLEIEHRIYPEAVRRFAEGSFVIDGMRVKYKGDAGRPVHNRKSG